MSNKTIKTLEIIGVAAGIAAVVGGIVAVFNKKKKSEMEIELYERDPEENKEEVESCSECEGVTYDDTEPGVEETGKDAVPKEEI